MRIFQPGSQGSRRSHSQSYTHRLNRIKFYQDTVKIYNKRYTATLLLKSTNLPRQWPVHSQEEVGVGRPGNLVVVGRPGLVVEVRRVGKIVKVGRRVVRVTKGGPPCAALRHWRAIHIMSPSQSL